MQRPRRASFGQVRIKSGVSDILHYVHRLTGNPDMAEDVAQDALVRFMVANEKRRITKPRAWLFSTATNLVRDHARRQEMIRRRTPPNDGDPPRTPEQDLERRESIDRVRRVLGRLSERDRELLVLRESGFRYREIAEVLGVKTESVSTLALRALARFRTAWSAEENR